MSFTFTPSIVSFWLHWRIHLVKQPIEGPCERKAKLGGDWTNYLSWHIISKWTTQLFDWITLSCIITKSLGATLFLLSFFFFLQLTWASYSWSSLIVSLSIYWNLRPSWKRNHPLKVLRWTQDNKTLPAANLCARKNTCSDYGVCVWAPQTKHPPARGLAWGPSASKQFI